MHPAPESPAGSAGQGTVVFTIVSRNYFHFAVNLMASVAEHLPGTRRVVAICDERQGLESPDPGIELLGIEDVGIAALDAMVVQYSILELNTAIKPFVFSRLFADAAAERVIYFDPDIQLFGSGVPLLKHLQEADVVLTPHLTAPLADDKHPSDISILQSGTYNLGFVAMRRCDDTAQLLRWWQAKLERDCVVDIPRGLFTDQKWMDLVPGFCERTVIERHPGWNVAYWNLMHRHIESGPEGFTVNGKPLFFFHFSGYDPRSASISKHQDRFTLAACTPATQRLFALYTANLAAAGKEKFAAMPYAFAKLADGTPLPDCARRAVRRHLDWSRPRPPLRSAAGAQFVIDFVRQPVDALQPPVSRLALQLYEDRADLQAAFPDMLASRREAFLNWFAERAGPEAGITGALMQAQAPAASVDAPVDGPLDLPAAASAPVVASAAIAPASVPAVATPSSAPAPVLPYRLVYRLAWRARHVLRPMTSLAFRQRMREALLRRAFPAAPSTVAPKALVSAPAAAHHHPPGVTVIGYVQAESGVGESARSTLRALACSEVAHSVQDYRVGNVSRMGEAVDAALANGRQHAISLFHINADQLPAARTFLGEAPFTGTYRIGFWAWELENFPAEWHGAFAHVDEVWVPSSFCQRAIAAVSPVPVLVMPHCVEVPAQLSPDRARFGLRADSVTFLAMADMMSIAGRKNPFAAVQAFRSAFAADDTRVQLIVKIANAHRDVAAHDQLKALVAGHPQILLLDESLDRPTLNRLLDSVDCFVSLHRSEGFGLVMAEAMARGKVVVATDWSGNTDFMNAHNALPVDYQLVTLQADAGPYRQGERWAEPSQEDAIRQMRRVANEPDLRRSLGERARQDCARCLSPQAVADLIGSRLQKILRQMTASGRT